MSIDVELLLVEATIGFLFKPQANPVTENCPLSWHHQLSAHLSANSTSGAGATKSHERVLRISAHSITPWLVGLVSEGGKVLSSLRGE